MPLFGIAELEGIALRLCQSPELFGLARVAESRLQLLLPLCCGIGPTFLFQPSDGSHVGGHARIRNGADPERSWTDRQTLANFGHRQFIVVPLQPFIDRFSRSGRFDVQHDVIAKPCQFVMKTSALQENFHFAHSIVGALERGEELGVDHELAFVLDGLIDQPSQIGPRGIARRAVKLHRRLKRFEQRKVPRRLRR